MFTKNQLKTLDQRHVEIKLNLIERRYQYLGILNEYQTIAKDLKQEIVYIRLNPYQHLLFKRVLHGTNIYSKEEVDKMHWDKKRRIKKVWKRAQTAINVWKQTICNKATIGIFEVFYNSQLAKDILKIPITVTDDSYKNKLSFKDLGIKYEYVILFFMGQGLLPKNYLSLK